MDNTASGWDTVAMGTYSAASGHYALAAGYYSTASHQAAFVWSDSSTIPGANSTVDNSVAMRASGGYRFFSNPSVTAGVSLAAGGTAWVIISDRNVKKDIAPVDHVEIIEKLAALPITQWRYQWKPEAETPHIGPMAQDFKGAFYPDSGDKSIATQEADGVALAAIQGRNQKLTEVQPVFIRTWYYLSFAFAFRFELEQVPEFVGYSFRWIAWRSSPSGPQEGGCARPLHCFCCFQNWPLLARTLPSASPSRC